MGPLPRYLRSLILVALLGLAGTWAASSLADEALAHSKPLVVKVHADWCSTCRLLEPTWARIRKELGERARVVDLDVSNRAAVERSRAQANRLGIEAFFQKYSRRTGTIAVLDGRTLELVSVFRGERDFSKYEEAVAALDRAS